MTYSQVGVRWCPLPHSVLSQGSQVVAVTLGRGPRLTRCERNRSKTGSAAARIATWSIVLPGQGVSASTYLGKTAEWKLVALLGVYPSASMRAASLSHIEVRQRMQFAIRLFSEIISPFVIFVNSFCVYIAMRIEIDIANSNE